MFFGKVINAREVSRPKQTSSMEYGVSVLPVVSKSTIVLAGADIGILRGVGELQGPRIGKSVGIFQTDTGRKNLTLTLLFTH